MKCDDECLNYTIVRTIPAKPRAVEVKGLYREGESKDFVIQGS